MPSSLPLDELYRDVAPDLEAVEEEIRAALQDDEPAIAAMTSHASRYGGKRLRPAMALLVSRAAGSASPRHVRLGAVLELIHLATLVHDDVIDVASLRRSQKTVNETWGNYEAVLLGDIIFARAIHLLARLGDTRALLGLTSAVSTLCSGEILQNRHRHDLELAEDAYYRIIDAKTAELYAAGCELAAHLGGATEDACGAFREFGRELGLAFQIVDDVIDLVGDEDVAGKTLGSDLESGKMTLPLILFREQRGADRALLQRVVVQGGAPSERRDLVQRLRSAGCIDSALRRASSHVERGVGAVRRVLSSERCGPLEALGAFVLNRRL